MKLKSLWRIMKEKPLWQIMKRIAFVAYSEWTTLLTDQDKAFMAYSIEFPYVTSYVWLLNVINEINKDEMYLWNMW